MDLPNGGLGFPLQIVLGIGLLEFQEYGDRAFALSFIIMSTLPFPSSHSDLTSYCGITPYSIVMMTAS